MLSVLQYESADCRTRECIFIKQPSVNFFFLVIYYLIKWAYHQEQPLLTVSLSFAANYQEVDSASKGNLKS
jgi:hypothetical protein